MDMFCDFYELGTEFLNIIQLHTSEVKKGTWVAQSI
jgi:hypothetical protein